MSKNYAAWFAQLWNCGYYETTLWPITVHNIGVFHNRGPSQSEVEVDFSYEIGKNFVQTKISRTCAVWSR